MRERLGTQEHPLPYLSERNSAEMQISHVLTDEVFFRIYSWKIPFPKAKTDCIFGFRYQFRILTYAYVCVTVCKIILQTRGGECLSWSPGGL